MVAALDCFRLISTEVTFPLPWLGIRCTNVCKASCNFFHLQIQTVSRSFITDHWYCFGWNSVKHTVVASRVYNDHVFDRKFNDHLSQIVQRGYKYGISGHFVFNLMQARNNTDWVSCKSLACIFLLSVLSDRTFHIKNVAATFNFRTLCER